MLEFVHSSDQGLSSIVYALFSRVSVKREVDYNSEQVEEALSKVLEF